MTHQEVIQPILDFAPLKYQESYDNSGFQVGFPQQRATAALLTLDVTEEIIEEAIAKKCNLIIAHHPLIFKPFKKIIGSSREERIILKAIQNNITIFAAHTNLDNMANGVNKKIAEKLGLKNTKILSPIRQNILKLHSYVPEKDAKELINHLFAAGAGAIGNYDECCFHNPGYGSFRPNQKSHPTIGEAGGKREYVKESRFEIIFPEERKDKILKTLFEKHPYEEVSYGILRMENTDQTKGAGMVGTLPEAISFKDFLALAKEKMKAYGIRYTSSNKEKVKKIAFCGGSGSFLLKDAIKLKADIFLTGDFKYHQFFDADNQIDIVDIGHFESEQYTIEIFSELLREKFPNFAACLTEVNTNPINYYR